MRICESYCGHLPDWYEACPCHIIKVVLKRTDYDLITEFKIHYNLTQKRQLTFYTRSESIQNGHISLRWAFDNMQDIYQIIMLHIVAHKRTDLVGIKNTTLLIKQEIPNGELKPS